MELLLTPSVVYRIGVTAALLLAVLWSFALDKQKPSTAKEFFGKLFARALFLSFMFAIVMGFLYLALGVFKAT